MEFRKNFRNLIFSKTFDLFDISKNINNSYNEYWSNIDDLVNNNFPKSLYRYRTFNSNNLLDFINDEIYAGKACNFNDPFDTIPVLTSDELYQKFYESYKSSYSNSTYQSCKDHINELVDEVIKEKRDEYKICCFAENYNNPLMWAHYSEGHKGFCLEYEFCSNEIKYHEKGLRKSGSSVDHTLSAKIYPVIYSDSTNDFINEINSWLIYKIQNDTGKVIFQDGTIKIDDDFSLKMALVKENIWSYEKEWRLVCRDYLKAPFIKIKLKPVKIIYGLLMPEEQKKSLKEIAKTKGILIEEIVAKKSADGNSIILEKKQYKDL